MSVLYLYYFCYFNFFISFFFFFFNDTATTEIYTLSLHDALPISPRWPGRPRTPRSPGPRTRCSPVFPVLAERSEEHTSELQSRPHLVCRLLLEKKTQTTCQTLVNIITNFLQKYR